MGRFAKVASVAIFAWLFQAACDPCFGAVPACSSEPRLVVMGRLGKFTSGRAIDGAEVTMIRRRANGVVDSITTKTGGAGYFQLEMDPDGDSTQHFDLLVQPPGLRGYRMLDVTAPLVRARGEAHPIGMLTDQAFFTARFVQNRRCAVATVKESGPVAIQRLSGPSFIISGSKVDTFAIRLGTEGEVALPVGLVEVDTVTTLIATARTTGGGEKLAAGFRLDPQPFFQQRPDVILSFAPESSFVGCVIHRGSSEPLKGITVDFTRTGGAATTVSSATVLTDSLGRFLLNLKALQPGDVIGDVRVHGFEASSTYVVRNVTIPAAAGFRADTVFGIGLHLPYFGLVGRFNTPMAGVRVTIKRTGGISAKPDSITSVTGSDGRFNASAFRITEPGDLIVSITVTPPEPLRPFRIENVHLTARDGDPQGIRLFDIDAGSPPPGSVLLSKRANGLPR